MVASGLSHGGPDQGENCAMRPMMAHAGDAGAKGLILNRRCDE